MEIFIKNLPKKTSEAKIRELFAPFGELSRIKMVCDNFSKEFRGIAFVNLDDDQAAQNAIAALDKSIVDENEISVSQAISREGRPLSFDGRPRKRRFNDNFKKPFGNDGEKTFERKPRRDFEGKPPFAKKRNDDDFFFGHKRERRFDDDFGGERRFKRDFGERKFGDKSNSFADKKFGKSFGDKKPFSYKKDFKKRDFADKPFGKRKSPFVRHKKYGGGFHGLDGE